MKKNSPEVKLKRIQDDLVKVKTDVRFLKKVILQVKSAQQQKKEETVLNEIDKELDKA